MIWNAFVLHLHGGLCGACIFHVCESTCLYEFLASLNDRLWLVYINIIISSSSLLSRYLCLV